MIKKEIQRTIELFHKPGDVVELRVVKAGKGGSYNERGTFVGCFNDFEKMANEAVRLDGKAPAVYFTLNQCNPLIFARSPNEMASSRDVAESTSDTDIIRRRWLPIDLDAVRPSGVSAPNGLHEQALAVSDDIHEWLTSQGWPEPIKGDSGNGGHLCYALDLPNDDQSKELIKSAIEAIAGRFSIPEIDIDKTVYNAGRIWKLYGTMSGKGANTQTQPHRRSKIISVPKKIEVVSPDLIKKIIPVTAVAQPTKGGAGSFSDFNVEEKCRSWGLTIRRVEPWKNGTRHILVCPFDPSHTDTTIIKLSNGALSFKCPHNSCADKDWKQLREKFEPEATRKPAQKQYSPDLWEGMEQEIKPAGINERINPWGDLAQMKRNAELQATGERTTIDLPWPLLSERSRALRPGCVLVLAGPVKSGKSFLAMNVIANIHSQGHSWRYLPLEDDREAWAWRMLAILHEDYRYIEDKKETAAMRIEAITKNSELLHPYLTRVSENPRINVIGKNGKAEVPAVSFPIVLDWAEKAADNSRVFVIDPFAQIDFDARNTIQEHQVFIRRLLAIVAGKNTTAVLIAHLSNRGGDKGVNPMTADDVQGSKDLTRLAQTTILLDRHDTKDSIVFRSGGLTEMISHNRTAIMAAVRNGSGTGQKIAMNAETGMPIFSELGVINVPETNRLDKQRNKRK